MPPSERHPPSWQWEESLTSRLIGLLGIVGPMLCALVFTIAGWLRPGYSPIRQVISDLGVGPYGWLLNTDLILSGLLSIIFALGFYLWMRPVLRSRWLLVSTFLLVLSGAGIVNEGIFHQPAALEPAAQFHLVLHGLGLAVAFYSLIIALFLLGWSLCRLPAWRRSGWYLLLCALLTLGLLTIPGQIAGSSHIWGLIERAQVTVGWSWTVVIGWRQCLSSCSWRYS